MTHPDRCENITTRVGAFAATICFHPETNVPVAVFFTMRGKIGHHLDNNLRDLGIEISKIMQGE